MESPQVEGFLMELDLGGQTTVALRFDRIGQSNGNWHQVQVAGRVRISSALPAFGSWSLGLRDATMKESIGLSFDNLVGTGSHSNDIWLYSGQNSTRVGSIEGSKSFPPVPRNYRGGLVKDCNFSILDSKSGKISSVGAAYCTSCDWQDVSQRGLFKQSNWGFDTSKTGASAAFEVTKLKPKIGLSPNVSSGSYYFSHPTPRGKEYYETMYTTIGASIGLDLSEVGTWAAGVFSKVYARAAAVAKNMMAASPSAIRAVDAASALSKNVSANAGRLGQQVLTASGPTGAKVLAAGGNVVAGAKAKGPAVFAAASKASVTESTTSMTSGAFWNVFYGPDAGSQLGPDDFAGQCYMVDFGGNYCIQGGSITLVFFNADMPPLFCGLLLPPYSWHAAAVIYGKNLGWQLPGLALTFSRGVITVGRHDHETS